MQNRIKFILLMLLLVYTSIAFSSQAMTIKEVTSLKDIATALKSADPATPDNSDLVALDNVIVNAKVVGLGEGTHGTHEFFQMKHRILQYLVQKKGFTIFAIEASMPQAFRLNDYILNGKGDPKKLIVGMGFWTWSTKEVLAMVEWMHEYNKTAEKKLKFTGFDMQMPPNTYGENITDRLNKAGKEDESQVVKQIIIDIDPVNQKTEEYYSQLEIRDLLEEKAFKNYLKLLADLKEQHLPIDEFNKKASELEQNYKNEIQKIDALINPLIQRIKDEAIALITPINMRLDNLIADIVNNKILFVDKIGSDEYEWMLENIQLIKEYLQLQSAFEAAFYTRDRLMAKNILWIMNQNPNSKIVLWAHNGHIGHSNKYLTMGKYLQNELGDNYQAIGFLTSEGKYTAISFSDGTPKLGAFDLQMPPDDAMEAITDKLTMPIVLLNFSNKDKLPDFLHNPVLSRCRWGIGAEEVLKEFQFNPPPDESYSDYIGFNYDGIIFIKTTMASQLFSSAVYPTYRVISVENRIMK